MTDNYMICRVYRKDRPIEILKRGLTKEQALAHVNGRTGSGCRGGGYFDVFTKEN